MLHAILCVALFVGVLIETGWTQPAYLLESEIDYEREEIAHLDITISHNDAAHISLWHAPSGVEWLSDTPPPLPETWRQDWPSILQAVTQCEKEALTVETLYGSLSVAGSCTALQLAAEPSTAGQLDSQLNDASDGSLDDARNSTRWKGELSLSPLVEALADIDVDWLQVWLSIPQIGTVETVPAGNQRSDHSGSFVFENVLLENFPLRMFAGAAPVDFVYDVKIADPALTQIRYRYGFTQQQISRRTIGLLAALLLPLLAAWGLRSHALRRYARSPSSPLWFGYQRSLSHLSIAVWVLWLAAAFSTQLFDWLPALFPSLNSDWTAALLLMGVVWPPCLLDLTMNLLSYRVMKEVGQLDYSRGESFILFAASKGVTLFPLTLVALAWLMFERNPAAIGLGAAAFLGLIVSLVGLQRLGDGIPHAVTTGELRDRIFQLAKSAGVELKQIYLLPMKRSRMVNAFALQNNTVMVTDYLLRQLSKAEVDGVMAHELAHLQLKHPAQLSVRLPLLFVFAFWIVPIFTAPLLSLIPYTFLLQLLVSLALFFGAFYRTSRRFEYQADAQAALLTGNPQALITGLIKIAHLNQTPLTWSKWNETLMTHPSMHRRIAAIANRHSIPESKLTTLLTQITAHSTDASDHSSPNLAADHYNIGSNLDRPIHPETSIAQKTVQKTEQNESTASASEQTLLFSTQFKDRCAMRVAWLFWLCFGLGGVVVGRLVQLLPTPGLRWIGYSVGAIAILGLYFHLLNTAPTYGYAQLRQQFMQRLKAEGFTLHCGEFVGFAPSAEPRDYEGHSVWDVGWLHLSSHHQLCYVGERLRFALSPHQITQITLHPSDTPFIKTEAIAISWQDEDLNHHVFKVQPLEADALSQLRPITKKLMHQLEDWRAGKLAQTPDTQTNDPSPPQSLQPPKLGAVTSSAPAMLSMEFALVTWLSFVLVAFAIAAITHSLAISPALTLFIFTMPTLGAGLQLWPAFKRTISSRALKP